MRLLLIFVALVFSGGACAQTHEDRREAIEALSLNPSEEALTRRARSITELRRLGVPVLDNLPVIADTSTALRRTEKEVTERLIALVLVSFYAQTQDRETTERLIHGFRATSYFTPDERQFLDSDDPTFNEINNFIWRYEAARVLSWALGFSSTFGKLDETADIDVHQTVMSHGEVLLRKFAKLRPMSEILDAADLTYGASWATVYAAINGMPPPVALNPGVVYERHYALKWLVGYMGQAWDDISTDT